MHLQLILYTYRKLQPSKWNILYQNNVQLFVSFCCCEILLSLEYTQKYVWVIVLQCHEDVMLNVYEYWKLRWSLFPAWNKLWRCKPCYTEGLHPTGAVRNMNMAHLHLGTPQRAPGRSPLCLCWDCFALNVIPSMVSCLASANWILQGCQNVKQQWAGKKPESLIQRHVPVTAQVFYSHPILMLFGSDRISSSQGRQRPCSGLWWTPHMMQVQ